MHTPPCTQGPHLSTCTHSLHSGGFAAGFAGDTRRVNNSLADTRNRPAPCQDLPAGGGASHGWAVGGVRNLSVASAGFSSSRQAPRTTYGTRGSGERRAQDSGEKEKASCPVHPPSRLRLFQTALGLTSECVSTQEARMGDPGGKEAAQRAGGEGRSLWQDGTVVTPVSFGAGEP